MILTAARVYAVWGEDFSKIAWLARRDRHGSPAAAICVQTVIAVLLVLLVGTQAGRDAFDAALHCLRLHSLPWNDYDGGFGTLVAGTAPVYWGLCLLGGVAVFILRRSDRTAQRPYRIPLYPLPAIVLCASCAYLAWSSLSYAKWLALIGLVPLALGGIAWYAARSARQHPF